MLTVLLLSLLCHALILFWEDVATSHYRCQSVALERVRYKRNSLNASSLNANLTVFCKREEVTTLPYPELGDSTLLLLPAQDLL